MPCQWTQGIPANIASNAPYEVVIHTVPGVTLTEFLDANESSLADRYRYVDLESNGNRNMTITNEGRLALFDSITIHPDLAKIAALDTVMANDDRHSSNLHYDSNTDRFYAIDNEYSFGDRDTPEFYKSAILVGLNDTNLNDLDSEKLKNLRTYASTLRKITRTNPPESVMRRMDRYTTAVEGKPYTDPYLYDRMDLYTSSHRTAVEIADYIEGRLGK